MRKMFFVTYLVNYIGFSYADTISYNPMIDVNTAGQEIIVWQSYDTVSDIMTIKSSYSEDGINWSPSEIISQQDSKCYHPNVLIDSGGNAVVVWIVVDNITYVASIYAAMYSALSSSWGPYEYIGLSNDVLSLKISISGVVMLAFTELDNDISIIKHISAVCGTPGWSTPVTISP